MKKAILAVMLAATMSARAASVLCIGLNDYDKFPDLKHAENDAKQLATAFASRGDTVVTITGKDVTNANIMKALAANPDLVYFAGHGEKGHLMTRDGEIALASIANAHTMMIMDCCYIGHDLKTAGTMKILAASEYEAFESGDHGLFTKYLLTWLGTGKSLDEAALTPYLTKNIRAETGGWQKPVLGFI